MVARIAMTVKLTVPGVWGTKRSYKETKVNDRVHVQALLMQKFCSGGS